MSQPETQPTEVDAEAQALAEAQAGYAGKARAPAEPSAAAPADTADVQPAAATPLADSVPPSASTPDPEPAPDPQAAPAAASPEAVLRTELEDLKAQVKALKDGGADAATVRKMHGDIGEINRTLQQLRAGAPVGEKLTAALKRAEAVAEEYPDIAAPLVDAIKAFQEQVHTPAPAQAAPATPDPQPQEPTHAQPAEERDANGYTAVERAAIEALNEVHPDRFTIKASPEYQAWFATWKTPEYREKVNTSWNPAVVAEPFTAFKAHLAARKKTNDRLDAAVQPQGTAQTPQSSTIPDEAGFARGYAKVKRLVA
jgi:hypothetical protein